MFKRLLPLLILLITPAILPAQEIISFSDTVPDTKRVTLSIEEQTLELNEVTVTALGIPREERSLGYATTKLKGAELNQNSLNPIMALQGKVAGLNISGSSGGMFGRQKITLRGASTLNSNNQPLIVVDGVAVHTSVWETVPDYFGNSNDWGDELKNLNVADIESISVLKGAAATALYGSRGMNGALVITTKAKVI